MPNTEPTKLNIINGEKNIFDPDSEYVIPLYQRAYSWREKQLIQLVEDIADVSEDSNYYIGSLIVSKQENRYEVVDGQQRLTSLYLLLNCLGVKVKNNLKFDCRTKSNFSLENVTELLKDVDENKNNLEKDRIEDSIKVGIKILSEELKKQSVDPNEFIKKLSKVILYRIEVPMHTDLNRYFEIMNTRGEQLEQHDILKAKLMSCLNQDEQSVFATIWDGCSDMSGYVQMHFTKNARENLFGYQWNGLPKNDWNCIKDAIQPNVLKTEGACIGEIIKTDFTVKVEEGFLDEDERVRFESVIEFPYFLIHTLKVFITTKNIVNNEGQPVIIPELLDDKKLITYFSKVCEDGYKSRNIDVATFSRDFIICLLRTRFLFDKYIIKREFVNENSDGEWSLKSLYVSGQQSKKKPYYRNTVFTQAREWVTTNDRMTKSNIMIQSALRVSYTSQKVMHWITGLLIWLSTDNCRNIEVIGRLTEEAEKVAQKAVKENFFDFCPNDVYELGVNTPHIVFNYLDYLIWKESLEKKNSEKYTDFVFEFRNSVEHWYPRNPSEGTFQQWIDGVDSFGNLCVIQRNVNSRFSNMSPEAKKSTFNEMIGKGSLKLRLMSELTEKHNNQTANFYWRETAYKEHEKQMIALLRKACNL